MQSLLINIGYLGLGINFLLFVVKFLKLTLPYKIFTGYLFTIIVIQFFTSYLGRRGMHNLFLSHFYFVLQCLILSVFYYKILKSSFQKKVILISIPLVLITLGIQYFLKPDLFSKFNLFEIFITSFIIIIFALFHLYNILSEKKDYFYLNLGILFYLFCSSVLFMAGNLIATLTDNFRDVIWKINAVLYIVYQLFIFLEWYRIFIKKSKS